MIVGSTTIIAYGRVIFIQVKHFKNTQETSFELGMQKKTLKNTKIMHGKVLKQLGKPSETSTKLVTTI